MVVMQPQSELDRPPLDYRFRRGHQSPLPRYVLAWIVGVTVGPYLGAFGVPGYLILSDAGNAVDGIWGLAAVCGTLTMIAAAVLTSPILLLSSPRPWLVLVIVGPVTACAVARVTFLVFLGAYGG